MSTAVSKVSVSKTVFESEKTAADITPETVTTTAAVSSETAAEPFQSKSSLELSDGSDLSNSM